MAPAEEPLAWLFSVALGLAISLGGLRTGWRESTRALFFCLGQTILLTAPLAGHLQPDLFGAFPTVDKTGSIAFYLDGLHRRLLFHPIQSLSDPAVQLIGIHACHLWVSELFDLFLSTAGAFNIQAIVYPTLGWWCGALLAREVGTDWPTAIALAFGFGMGLHVFADLNWYTVEKAAVFTLALYAYCLVRTMNGSPKGHWLTALAWSFTLLINLYFALVAAMGTALLCLISREKAVLRASVTTALVGLPLVGYQLALLSAGTQPADADAYLHLRAAQDVLDIGKLAWNRLELWRSVDLVLVVAALCGAYRSHKKRRVRAAIALFLALSYFSLGPFLAPGIPNPGWQAVRSFTPGLWRLSEPEVFFQGSVLMLIVVAAAGLGKGRRLWLYPVCVACWVFTVRSHPAFPGYSEFKAPRLSPTWHLQQKGQQKISPGYKLGDDTKRRDLSE